MIASVIELFACKIKEDTFKTVTDQSVYWTGRIFITVSNFHIPYSGGLIGRIEEWLFYHGWLLLLVGRLFLLFLDIYKRVRDVKKPEWDNVVKPVLKREAVEDRRKTTTQKIKDFFFYLFRL